LAFEEQKALKQDFKAEKSVCFDLFKNLINESIVQKGDLTRMMFMPQSRMELKNPKEHNVQTPK
jgi:hypothetical protein